MTLEELNELLDKHKYIEWVVVEDGIAFRNTTLLWYRNNKNNATKITFKKLNEMTEVDFFNAINCGLEVDQITRITGYFSKISNWNPGKMAELRDRFKGGL